jgi:hypothetical protein
MHLVLHGTRLLWLYGFTNRELIVAHRSRSAQGRVHFITTLFLFIVKFLGWLMRTRQEEVADPPPPTKEEVLLTEIRDLLREEVHGRGERQA